jgi:DNA-binding MarR family transcriptional regulator
MAMECYCAALRAASRKVTALYDAALEPMGVNLAQFSLLRNIARGEPMSLTELGRKVELDRSTIGRNVRVLERLGLVTLAAGADQREAMVALDERGRTVLEQGVPAWDEAQARIETRIGTETARALRTLLQAL